MGVREGKNWGREEICPIFRIVPEMLKKFYGETFQNCCRRGRGEWLRISHKIDRISHKIDKICPIYVYNKPILPDCEANIAGLALFVQQTGGLPPPPPRPCSEPSTGKIFLALLYHILQR
jgi:hypothetical protein